MRRARRAAARIAELEAELAAHRDAVRLATGALGALADGDLEARVPRLGDAEELAGLRRAANLLADRNDAFVREAAAALAAACEGRYHRRLLVRGLPGAFRAAAETINTARTAMQENEASSARREARTRAELEAAVSAISDRVADTSADLAASAEELTRAVSEAGAGAVSARDVIHTLEQSSQQIQTSVALIKKVAEQTNLLALNASIEAARAGAAGRGFAVVADEVKNLAATSARSSDDITARVDEVRAGVAAAVASIGQVTGAVAEMGERAQAVETAATGSGGEPGLSRLAVTLRDEIARFTGGARV
ncbi:methyl-accepting chemotaxis protein [Nocardioides pantholopis]|uniref:methyl-accepting chemotaxis protein n=1 Tax=Nocardioides pantholopis TaxID=2483798 RepID=UPI000F08FF44|nr:methyl-accepting chemotaxis protein [Nocardioides pantholopis]